MSTTYPLNQITLTTIVVSVSLKKLFLKRTYWLSFDEYATQTFTNKNI